MNLKYLPSFVLLLVIQYTSIQIAKGQDTLLTVDFQFSSPLLCAGNCLQINNLTTYAGNAPVSYSWNFTGADQNNSSDVNIEQLCFANEGTFTIELVATAGGQSQSVSKNIAVLPLARLDLGVDSLASCNGTPVLLDASNSIADNYFWQDGSTEPIREVDTTGLYIVQANNPCGNVRDSVFVTFSPPLLPPDLPDTYSLCEVDSITLDISTPNALAYNWDDGTTLPIRTFNAAGNYQLEISNDCEAVVVNFLFEDDDCCNFYAPNAFSPNLDGRNDTFQIFFNTAACGVLEDFQLQIFDRWGGKVFETTEINFRWDGQKRNELLQPGAYFWRMAYSNDGSAEQAYGEILLVN